MPSRRRGARSSASTSSSRRSRTTSAATSRRSSRASRPRPSKATQAQSRVKALARMQPIAAQIEERVAPFLFPNPAKAFASPLVRLEGAAAGYAPGEPVLQGLDLRLDADDRVGLLGANGNGKSTFARLIAGRLAADGGQALCLRQDRGRLLRPAPDRGPGPAQDALPAHAGPDARGDRGAAPRQAGRARLRHRQGRHAGREPLRRREGAPAVRARHLPRAAPPDPRRADQPSRRRCARGAGARAQRLRGRRHPDQPRPPPDGRLRRPAVDRARRHGAALRRRHGELSRRSASPSAAPAPIARAAP